MSDLDVLMEGLRTGELTEARKKKPLPGSLRPTRAKQVEQYLAQRGYPHYKLVHGRGYWYFWSDEPTESPRLKVKHPVAWGGSSVNTFKLNGYTLKQWFELFLDLASGEDSMIW